MNANSPNSEHPDDAQKPQAPVDDLSDRPHIVVIGGINMDLVVRTSQMPQPGRTVNGHSFATLPGGKGANQALAASLSGAWVSLIGRVGNDDFSRRLLVSLKHYGVDISRVTITEGVSTGVSMTMVDDNGDNAVCTAAGANLMLTNDDIDENNALFKQADLILMQLEIPQKTAIYALQLARQHNIPVMINPSPVPSKIEFSLFDADIMIANEDEIAQLTKEPVNDAHSAKLAGAAIVARGVKTVVATLGRRGAVAITSQKRLQVPSFNVNVVDTSGAGDAFCGAFAAAWTMKKDLKYALRFANAAGSLACSKFGAQPSIPRLDAIEKLLKRSC